MDFFMDDPREGKKKAHHQMTPYLIYDYLVKESCESSPRKTDEIVGYIESLGILIERRSVYRDIAETNLALYCLKNDCDIEEAEEDFEEDESRKIIQYNKSKKGFFVSHPEYTIDDIRLLAECVYSTKFISQKKADMLTDIIFSLISEAEAEKIRHDAYLVGRVKSDNSDVFKTISVINEAKSKEINGEDHVPQQVSFNYLRYSITDMKQSISRSGKKYVVSPYQLIINDGYYYLLAYNSEKDIIQTFRIDRISKIALVDKPREGEKKFDEINMETYTQRVFSMFSGEKTRVTLAFIPPLLDTMIDRFGKKGVVYGKSGSNHYRVSADVEISDQFFGWISGFGKKVKIESPDVAEKYAEYLDKIREQYR